MPRRRWVGSTPTRVTPATAASAPGTRIRKPYEPVVPTIVLPSEATKVRSYSIRASRRSRTGPDGGPV